MTPAKRNQGIDALRGLSILLVVVHHIGIRLPLQRTVLAAIVPARVLRALNWNGYEAVFVFFVVSGFLITRRALERGALARIDLADFYRRRFARIAPCLLALLLVLAAGDRLGLPDYRIVHESQSLGRALAAALTFHLNWYEGRTGYLPGGWDVLWSLSIEELFYLAFPLVCRVLRPTWVLAVALAALALSLPLTRGALDGNEIWQEKAYLPGMAAIATGILAAIAVPRVEGIVTRQPWAARALVLVGALGLGSVLLVEDALWNLLGQGTMLVLTFATALLVVGLHLIAATRPEGRPLPGLGWLRASGRLTYEIYLTHMFVVLAVVRLVQGRGLVAYALALPLTFALGWLVARYLSLPAERRLRSVQPPR
jgi:peptidoglycan/LPS O-acetylase OafA/YrhL